MPKTGFSKLPSNHLRTELGNCSSLPFSKTRPHKWPVGKLRWTFPTKDFCRFPESLLMWRHGLGLCGLSSDTSHDIEQCNLSNGMLIFFFALCLFLSFCSSALFLSLSVTISELTPFVFTSFLDSSLHMLSSGRLFWPYMSIYGGPLCARHIGVLGVGDIAMTTLRVPLPSRTSHCSEGDTPKHTNT